jgi:hypothetical protein
VLALSAWAIWIGRRHLARAVRMAFSPRAAGGDRTESALYRWASLGFIVSFGYMIWFCWAAGCRVSVALAMIGLIVVYYVMWARLRAETGLGFIPFPLGVGSMMVMPFGSNALRPREIVTLFNVRWSYFPGFGESFEVCTGNSLEAFKIADSGRVEQRPLLHAMMVGFVVSLVVGVFVVMNGMYDLGFFNTRSAVSGWLGGQLKSNGTRIFNLLQNPSEYDPYGLIGVGAGGAFAIFLGAMRLRFWWWPFHPIGYLAANCWGMHWYCQPFFLGWVLKSMTIRYGGLRLFRRTVPLAIGIIVGDFVSQGFWVALLTTLRAAGVDI